MNGAVPEAQLINQTLTQETQRVDTGAVLPQSSKHGVASRVATALTFGIDGDPSDFIMEIHESCFIKELNILEPVTF